jgi:hypothetical protein
MGIGPAVFQSAGQRSEHYVPGAYSRSAAIGGGGGSLSAGNGVIMGKSTGGKPRELYVFSTVGEAREALVDGELLKAVAHAFSPGPGYAPQAIRAMRVNPGTQAARTMKSGVNDILTVKSFDYGVHTNRLKMRLAAGTNPGTKKALFAFKEGSQTIDNIGKQSFSVQYTGTGSGALLTVSADALVVAVTGADADSVTLNFEDFPTVEELVGRLNDSGNFAAVPLETESNVSAYELDAVSNAEIKIAPRILKSDLFALIRALENSYYVGQGNAEKAEGAANIMPDNDAGFVYFEGAVAGAYTVSEWNDALQKLEAEDIQIISTPSTDQAVHTLISNHCTAMGNVQNRKERTAIVGGPVGQTIDNALEQAAVLNNKLVSYCYPAVSAKSPLTGDTEHLPASYFACKLPGMEVAVAVNEPLTWKTVDVVEFLVKLRTSDMEKLIKGGVLCGGVTDDNRLAVIRAMTTWQGNQLQMVERSMVREDLYMNRDIRMRYSLGVGRPGVSKGGDAESVLQNTAREWKSEGLIVSDDNGKNVWGIVIRVQGDKTYIEFNRNLTPPQNFFFITAYNYVYESKTTVEV